MEMRRTAVVKLDVSDEQRRALHASREQFLRCANQTSEFCWSDRSYEECRAHKRRVRNAIYDDLRAETDLTANVVQAGIQRAVEAVKSGVDRWRKGRRTSQPEFTSWFIDFDKRSATFRRNEVSLSTVEGRVECPFVLPSDSPTPYERYVLDDDFEFRAATLHRDHVTGAFYLHLSMRRYDGDENGEDAEVSADTEHQTVLGIDLGVNSLAVASTGTFWHGDDYDHWTREFEERRAAMQQRGGQDAHNAMKRLGKRERAWRKQYVHTKANELVAEAVETDCDGIVFEDLTDIRKRLPWAEWHHIWAFRRLYEYVEYKAPEHGLWVEQVEAAYTSQRCSKCGFTHEDNRDGVAFACLSCGYRLNADYNAAKNVGLRYARQERHRLRSSPKSSGGDAPVNVRVNRGAMTDSGPTPIAAD